MNKKLLLAAIALILLAGTGTFASPWQWFVPDKTITVAWDAVDTYTDANGDTQTLGGGNITYRLYVSSDLMEDPANPGEYIVGKDSGVVVGETAELTYVVPIPSEGRYALGVQTIRTLSDGVEKPSPIGWSTDPAIASSGTFGVDNYFNPDVATNFRKP
jgi:hypothetical protein